MAYNSWRQVQGGSDNRAMNIGPAIRMLREERGLTLEALAHEVDSDASNLSRLERGLQRPGFDLLVDLATALGVKVSEICAMAEGEAAPAKDRDPALKAVVTKYQKLSPQHQVIVGELITSLLKLEKQGR